MTKPSALHIVVIVATVLASPCGSFVMPTSNCFGKLSPSSPPSKIHIVRLANEVSQNVGVDTSSLLKIDGSHKDEFADVVICGGGPAGLLSAIMLAQKFPEQRIKVYDRLSEPPSPTDDTVWRDFSKFYLIGLGGRGQTSLAKFGVWKDVEDVCTGVVGRKDWAPGSDEAVERIFEGRKFTTQVLPRDKLVSVLYKHIVDHYPKQVELNYGYEIRPIDFGGPNTDGAVVEAFQCRGATEQDLNCEVESLTRLSTKLLIAADGTARTVAMEIENYERDQRKNMNPIRRLVAGRPFKVTRYDDDNQRIYKTIPLKLPAGWRPDLNYSARSKGGRVNIDALPANSDGEYCGVLLLRKDDELAQADVDPNKLRAELDALLPMFSAIMDDDVVAQVAKKPPSFLPAFRFAGPRLNQGDHTLILGDCAHTVKPYFGLGANSALEDVKILSQCIDETSTLKEAVHEFSKRRAKDSERLVRISRELDRPGTIGTITFIIPIILDSIFSKLAPRIFAPNIITMLQKDDMTFEQVARRKRLDRVLQLAIIGAALTAVGTTTRVAVTSLARIMGRRSSTVAATLVGSTVLLQMLSRAIVYLVPGMAPADILAQSKTKITDNESIDNNN